MPLLWRDRVIGWGNLSVKNGELKFEKVWQSLGRLRLELNQFIQRERDFSIALIVSAKAQGS